MYETVWTGAGSSLLISMLEKLNWFRLTGFVLLTGAIDMKMDGSVLEEKSSFKMLGLTFSCKLNWGSYIIFIAKTASKKIGALIHYMKFRLRLLCISINLPYSQAWNTAVMSGLVLSVAS